MPNPQPNVLILMCDQLKAGAIGLYGNADVKTPNLERLAAKGALYQRHYVTAPMCVPSRTAFWTGMYPHNTGVRHNQVLMPTDQANYARLLDEAGYDLALFGKDHCFQGADRDLFKTRLELGHQGFAGAPENSEAKAVAEFLGGPEFSEQPTFNATIPYPPEACSTSLIANRTVEFLSDWKDSGETPFCAWVSFPDPHHPTAAPEPYASMYSPDQITMPPLCEGELNDKMERVRVFFHLMGFETTSETELRKAIAMHYGMIRFLDDGIGVILDGLDRLGMEEDTVVVFTADHGDYAGEHGMMLKSGTFYDCMTRVPLIVSLPGRIPEGQMREELVSNIDIMPTVMNLLGLEPDRPVNGRLLPGAGGEEPREAVFAEHGAGGPLVLMSDLERYPDYTNPLDKVVIRLMHARNAEGRPKMIRTDRWKYVYDPMDPVDELYDMDNDPWELTNLASRPEHAEVRSELRDRLLRWSIMTEDHSATPLYSDPVTLSDTPDGGPDFYHHALVDQ
jgi:arylsulfatase A-like enzyme